MMNSSKCGTQKAQQLHNRHYQMLGITDHLRLSIFLSSAHTRD